MFDSIKNAAIDASFRTYRRSHFDIKAVIDRYVRLIFDIHASDHDYYRYLISSQQIYFLLLLINFATAFFSLLAGIQTLAYFGLFGSILFIVCMYLNKRNHDIYALWIAYFGINLFSLIGAITLGLESGSYFFLLIIGPLLFLHPNGSLRLKSAMSLASAIHLFLLIQLFNNGTALYSIPAGLLSFMDFANIMALYVILAYFIFIYRWTANQSDKRLRELSQKWEDLASKDMLTGLYNRRAMSEFISAEASRINRGEKTFSLAILDIDKFKSINDTYGHQAGDIVIQTIADKMSAYFRHHDIVARWGGEEFIILFPETSIKSAARLTDSLRKTISSTRILYNEHEIKVTVTIGLASYNPNESLDACIKNADQALYYGKQAGRNQVVM